MSTTEDIAGMTEAAIRLENQRQKEKAEAERENSLQEEVGEQQATAAAASVEQNP